MDAAEAKQVTAKAAKKGQQDFITAVMLAIHERASMGYSTLTATAVGELGLPSTVTQDAVATILQDKGYIVQTFGTRNEEQQLIGRISWE